MDQNINDEYVAPINQIRYGIDWDKVQTVEDIKTILKTLDISYDESFVHFNDVKDLLVFAAV
jgi:hypothetical protein